MTTIWRKLKDAKDEEITSIATDMAHYMNNVERVNKEAEELMNQIDDEIDFDKVQLMNISYSRYGRSIYLSGMPDKETFEQVLIILTDRYAEGKKEGYGTDVRYGFETHPDNWDQNISIYLTVSTKLTGCKLIKEKVYVPEKITPAHEEEVTKVKCE